MGGDAGLLMGVAGGSLLVSGIIAAIVIHNSMVELSGQIEHTKSQIRTVTEAIDELTSVTQSFSNLSQLYGVLNMFWGRMSNDADEIGTMDDATAAQLGADVLEDTSSIDAAASVSTSLGDACTVYLDTLNKQGIIPPETQPMLRMQSLSSSTEAKDNDFQDTILEAQRQLRNGNLRAYKATMDTATSINMSTIAAQEKHALASGKWLDVPSLNSTGNIWGTNFSAAAAISTLAAGTEPMNGVIQIGAQIDGDFNTAKPQVIQMLGEVLKLSSQIKDWPANIPTDSARGQELQKNAIIACQQAQNYAAKANNAFVNFNHQATDFNNSVKAKMQECNDKKNSAKSSADWDMKHINIPFARHASGIAAYRARERASIERRLNAAMNDLDSVLKNLLASAQSGTSFDGQTQTWFQMVQNVSGKLGEVFNILAAVEGQLMEDPAKYADFINMEWAQLFNDTQSVLLIFGVHAPSAVRSALGFETVRYLPSALQSTLSKESLQVSRRNSDQQDQVRNEAPAMQWRNLASVRNRNGAPSRVSSFSTPRFSSDPGTERVLTCLSPPSALGSTLSKQAIKASAAFDKLEILLSLPYANSVIMQWDDSKTDKVTLLDVSMKLRRQYVMMCATEYDAVQDLSSQSLLQKTGADNVVSGKLKLDIFVRSTLRAVKVAASSAEATKNAFGKSAKDFEEVMKKVNANFDDMTKKIDGLNKDIETATKKERDMIITVIADVIATSFATAAILVAFGVSNAATGGEEMDFGALLWSSRNRRLRRSLF